MKTQMAKMFVLVVLGISLLTPRVWSHDLWLNMTDYTPVIWQHSKYAPTPRAKTVVYMGWGHAYPVADFIADKFWGGLERIEPDGSRVDMETGSEGYQAVRVDMDTPGARIFAAWVKPSFYGPVEGKPAADYEVSAVSLVAPNADEVKKRTDTSGKATLPLAEFYGPWIVKAGRSFPATGEMAKKCEKISYTATMTFAIPYIREN